MNLTDLLAYIDANINTKTGTDRITGALHNAVLKQTINSLIEIISTGFGGKISTSDNPGSFSNPIYFIATEKGTYNYCGGVSVAKLPAFIVFDGNEWSVMEFDLSVDIDIPEIKAKGVILDGAIPPTSPKEFDYYIFLGSETLNWNGVTINRPGVIYCKTSNPVSWGFEPFEKDISIDDIEGLANALQDAINAANDAENAITDHIESSNAHNADSIVVDSSSFSKNLTSEDNTVQKVAEKVDQMELGGSALASTWEPNMAAIMELTELEDGMDVGNYETGDVYEFDASSTAEHDGDIVIKPNYIDSNEPGRLIKKKTFSTVGHTHQALDVYMSDGKSVEEAVNETRKQDVDFSVNIPFNSLLTSMPETPSNTELIFVPETTNAIAGGKCIVVLTADGNSEHIPGFDPLFKQAPDSMIWDNTAGVKNTIEFFYDGTTYWYTIIRENSNIAYKSEVILKGGASGPFTPTHDDDPVPKKWTEDTIKQYVANYYPGNPSPDGENLGWYGVKWDEGRINSGCVRIGALSGYPGGGAYGETGYGINTRPLSNIPENLLFVHNKIKSVMLKDDGTENYDLDPNDGHNRAGVPPSVFGTCTASTNTSVSCTGLFSGNEDEYLGRYLHNTTNGKTNRYVKITGKVNDDTVTIEDPKNGSETSAVFDVGDTFELCTARFDGVDGQAMVKIPKIYFFQTYNASPVNSSKYEVSVGVSLYPYSGFSVHPAFIDGNNNEVDAIYIARFEASEDNVGLVSLPGFYPSHSKALPTFRTLAQARGTGWQLEMFWYRSLIQLLFFTEYADLNSDLRIPGYVYGKSSSSWKRKTGRTLHAGNSSISVEADSWHDSDIVDSTDWGENKIVAMSYRGIENLWGHMWKCLDGINVLDYNVYVTNNKSALASDTHSGYTDLGVEIPGNSYFNTIHAIAGAIVPKTTGGGSVYNYCDYVSRALGWRVCFSGGALYYAGNAGVSHLYAALDSGRAIWSFGARLCF
ncbi:hypothetical protein ACT29H_09425 [Thermophagus sp. OGC60D27]|uniref:hypothetical protein n=1 Tax=Thermophagus sp. OGC60D27 TaxID=3458415 RepID=UPI004037DD40